ncbi:hypothetical protein AB0J21_19000 [Streptomyces sp. NPDC049954]|uniref:hypothetical protein n=1 Tax=Streptomyces sp. NPDC049954 TaxID=3155779 RepID=UPI00343D972D
MKLRRALVTAAATAAIAPVALLSAPSAFAVAGESPTPAPTVTETVSTSPTATAGEGSASASAPQSSSPTPPATGTAAPGEGGTTAPSAPPSGKPTGGTASPVPSGTTSASPSAEPSEPSDKVCEDSKVDVVFSGLPGKIAKGSGWHQFDVTFSNNSKSTLTDLGFFAGVAADEEGEKLFSTKQVALQAKNPETGAWEAVELEGQSVDYLGFADSLKADYEITIPLRLNVTASAPAGAGFSLGAGVYADADGDCEGVGDSAYKFQIVEPGTDTSGTKPQEGGSIPLPADKPSAGSVPEVTGSLAETGAGSALPKIGLFGGIAVVAGAGVVFAVRRRTSGGGAAA